MYCLTLIKYILERLILLALISQTLNNKRVESIAFIVHGTSGLIHLCGKDERVSLNFLYTMAIGFEP